MPVISARFMRTLSTLSGSRLVPGPRNRSAGRSLALPGPGRVQLEQELRTAGFLVGLADRRGGGAQAVERPQEAPVGLVLPADVSAAAPAGLTELVESTVVPDPEACVRVDRVLRELTEPGPPVEEARRAGDDGLHRAAPRRAVGLRERGREALGPLGGRRGEDRLGRSAAMDANRSVGHARNLPGRRVGSYETPGTRI